MTRTQITNKEVTFNGQHIGWIKETQIIANYETKELVTRWYFQDDFMGTSHDSGNFPTEAQAVAAAMNR